MTKEGSIDRMMGMGRKAKGKGKEVMTLEKIPKGPEGEKKSRGVGRSRRETTGKEIHDGWIRDPLKLVEDVWGENIRKAAETKGAIKTRTGLTRQQEGALEMIGKISRAKLLRSKGARLSKEGEELSRKIGISIMSGQGAGKDFFAAICIFTFMLLFKQCHVLATATTATQLKNVLWKTLDDVMRLSIKIGDSTETELQKEFVLQNGRLYKRDYGGRSWFAEAVTVDKDASENAQAETLSGRHADYMLIVADEASGIPDAVFKPLEGTLTGVVNLLLVIFNPTKTKGFAIDSQSDERFVAYRWNCEETELVSKEHIKSMETKYGRESNTFRVRVLGLPPVSEKDCLIPWDWMESAVGRELKVPEEISYVIKGMDCGAGGDFTDIATRIGPNVVSIKKKNTPSLNDATDFAVKEYMRHETSVMYVDAIGIGWGVWSVLKDHPSRPRVESVKCNERAMNSDRFENVRAEMYWNLRAAFESGSIAFPDTADDEWWVKEVINQLGSTKYTDERGKIQIINKKLIRKELGESPDAADALAMTYVKPDSEFLPRRYAPKTNYDEYNRYSDPRYSWMAS